MIWLAQIRQFRAYARLPGTRRDTALTAATPIGLAELIGQAEQAARHRNQAGELNPKDSW